MPGFIPFLLHLARAVRNRRHVVALGELADHLLRDIGLERADVLAVLASPATAIPRGCSRSFAATDAPSSSA
jgi:uncharacterized protein YjiS (DUF1127 family)